MDASFLAEIAKTETEVATVTKGYTDKITELQSTMRKNLAAVLKERQQLCDKVENFWPDRFLDADGPVLKHFNGTTDPRIVRAITTFNVETEVNADGINRKFLISLKPNIAVASTELFFKVNQHLEVVASSGIQWKAGTEKSQKDSFFRIFETSFKPTAENPDDKDRMFLEDVVADFEELYQDPFNEEFSDEEDDFDSEEGSDFDSEEDSEDDE